MCGGGGGERWRAAGSGPAQGLDREGGDLVVLCGRAAAGTQRPDDDPAGVGDRDAAGDEGQR
jgi:hypothetical protein